MTTVRLDPATRETLDRPAEQAGETISEPMRDSIGCLTGAGIDGELSSFDGLRRFVGIADSSGRQLSRETGRRFQELLEKKRYALRPG